LPQQQGTQLQHEPTVYRSFEKTYNETKYNGSNAEDFCYRMRLSLGTLGILNVLKLDDSQYVVPTDPNLRIQNYILGGMTTSTGKLWMHLSARDILRRLNLLGKGLPAQELLLLSRRFFSFKWEGEVDLESLSSNSSRFVEIVEHMSRLGSATSVAIQVLHFSSALTKYAPHLSDLQSSTISQTLLTEAGLPIFNWPAFIARCTSVIGSSKYEDSAPLSQTMNTAYASVSSSVMSFSQGRQMQRSDQKTPLHMFCGHLDPQTGSLVHGWNIGRSSGTPIAGHMTKDYRRFGVHLHKSLDMRAHRGTSEIPYRAMRPTIKDHPDQVVGPTAHTGPREGREPLRLRMPILTLLRQIASSLAFSIDLLNRKPLLLSMEES
jgi:hypothetical protein